MNNTTTTTTTKTSSSSPQRPSRILRNHYILLLLLCLMVILNIILLLQQNFFSFDIRSLSFQQQQQQQQPTPQEKEHIIVVENDSGGGDSSPTFSSRTIIGKGNVQKCLQVETKTTTKSNESRNNNIKSLSESSLEDYIINTNSILPRIFITMPAKAAGTSLKKFTHQCTQLPFQDNFINFIKPSEDWLTSTYKLPQIIASHALNDQTLINLIHHSSPSRNLMIHIYRDETSRLISAIKYVVNLEVCRWTDKKAGYSPLNIALPDESYCMINELELIKLIKRRQQEIGFGNPETLTCDFYSIVDQNLPRNIIFVHYTKVNQLQTLLAKHYCPELLDSNQQQQQASSNTNGGGIVESNTSKDKPLDRIYVQLSKTKTSSSSTTTSKTINNQQLEERRVKLTDWLEEKSDFLEWSLKLKTNSTCQGRTNEIENLLMTCKDQIIQL